MPFHNSAAINNRELNVQQLDTAQISNMHEWDIYAQTDISFRHTVEENPHPRADAQRYKLIADVNLEAARASFSRACSSTTLFKIPSTIMCDRTFARDAYDAYYVDAMHDYLFQTPSELKVEDIPLLKSRLHSRYFSAFSKRPVYLNEHYEWRRLGHWVPGDTPDLDYFSDLQKASWFLKVEAWFRDISQRSGLPVPITLSLYFFHLELRSAERFADLADSERVRRLWFCAQHEYYVLFLATWWNELCYGGRAFIVKRETIDILHARCGNIQDIAGKPAQAIIERMRMFADMPQHHHNWLCFSDRSMESSPFIFAVKKVGVLDHGITGGRRLWCRRDHRSVTVSRYSSRRHRRLAILEERLSGPDLDDIPGLLSLVREQEWAQYNSLRVSELLQNLLALYAKTHSKLDEARRQLSDEERAHDQTKRDFDAMRYDLGDLERSFGHKRYQLDEANHRLDHVHRQLDDAQNEIDYLRRSRNEPRQAAHRGMHTPRGVGTTPGVGADEEMRSPHYEPRPAAHRGVHTPRGGGTTTGVGVDEEMRSPHYSPPRDDTTDAHVESTPGASEPAATSDGARTAAHIGTNAAYGYPTKQGTTGSQNMGGRHQPAVGCLITPATGKSSMIASPSAARRLENTSASLRGGSSTEGKTATALEQNTSGSPRPGLRKIRPGHLFYPMPKPTRPRPRSAQTLANSSKNDSNGKPFEGGTSSHMPNRAPTARSNEVTKQHSQVRSE